MPSGSKTTQAEGPPLADMSGGSACPFSVKSQKWVIIGGLINTIVLLLAYCAYQYFRTVPGEVVHTNLGAIAGTIDWSRNSQRYTQYLGIPYALKPEGERRFEPPEPALPWEGVRDSRWMPTCLQVEHFATGFILGQEDCLYLNVFVSHVGKRTNKPVMVYIHGGIFHVGGSEFCGARNFMDENVILVTLNYRLGAFGFLSTGDDVISGNMGLKDQNLAFKWIKENIHNFGGNPDKITIFGESAGGASVHHHLLAKASQGLFSRIIHQSGSSISYWAVYRNVKEQAKRFAGKFGCPTATSEEIASCLKKLQPMELVTAHRELMDFYRPQISTFVPTIEPTSAKSPFLTEEPMKLLQSGKFPKIPIMTGVNSQEGQLISKTVVANPAKLNRANDFWYEWAPRTLHYPESLTNVSRKLRDFYFEGVENINSPKYNQSFTDMFGDRLFIVRGSVAGRLESKFAPTYMYYYDYSGVYNTGELLASTQSTILPSWVNLGIYIMKQSIQQFFNQLPKRSKNACHSDEISMLFNRDFVHTISRSHPDYEFSRDLVKLWVSFASNDGPTLRFRNVVWNPVSSSGDMKYLRLSDDPAVISEPFEKRRLFWESLNLPNL